MTINHESVKTGCHHKWVDVGCLRSGGGLAWEQNEICEKCGIEAKTTWDDQNDIPKIRRRREY